MSIYIYRNNNDKQYYLSSTKPDEDKNLLIWQETEDIEIPETRLEGIVLRSDKIKNEIKRIIEHRRLWK